MHLWATFACALLAITAAQAETRFSQPPGPGPYRNYRDNPHYNEGEKIDVQWQTDLDSQDIVLWMDWPQQKSKRLLSNVRSTSLIWTASYDGFEKNMTEGQDGVFYFAIYRTGAVNLTATCHYFNVSLASTETVTVTSSSTTAAPTSTETSDTESTSASFAPLSTEATSTEATLTPTNTPAPGAKDEGLSTGAVAGIAVGATIGGIALLAGGGFFLWKHFRKGPGDAGGQYTQGQQMPPTQEYKPPELDASNWNYPPQAGPPPQSASRPTGPTGLYEAP